MKNFFEGIQWLFEELLFFPFDFLRSIQEIHEEDLTRLKSILDLYGEDIKALKSV